MKTFSALLLAACATIGLNMPARAQERVWRCGNEYTNDTVLAQQRRGCKLMEGGNVTIVQSSRPTAPAAPGATSGAAASAPAGSPRIGNTEQRARDSEARSILEAELQKTRERQAQLLKEYNDGEPEKQGSEAKNHQKYLDRVADMKTEIARNESDIAGLQREIDRLPAPGNPASHSASR
jgi:hypothetical protein